MTPDNPAYRRFAYADPPYPGQAHKYRDHPDFAGEVDHAELVNRLRTFDGWALSTSAAALQSVLEVCPRDVRVAIWNVKNSEHPGNRGRWWWSWEPVIVWLPDYRGPGPVVRNFLSVHSPKGWFGNDITGQKPEEFCRWIFALLGAEPTDTLEDLYPGSRAVSTVWEQYRSSPSLFDSGPVRAWHQPPQAESLL